MNSTITGCSGAYDVTTLTHTVRYKGDVVVIYHVPAEVCDICGDVFFSPETLRHIEKILAAKPTPAKEVSLYEYA
jgi:YgiT-type zinc finger domain-containing protein